MEYKFWSQARERIKNIVRSQCTDFLVRQSFDKLVRRFNMLNGGRTRDRTLDLSRVKGTLSR
jgi:hypothetical protein